MNQEKVDEVSLSILEQSFHMILYMASNPLLSFADREARVKKIAKDTLLVIKNAKIPN